MNKLTKLLSYLIILLGVISCETKDTIYSCDPEINKEIELRLAEIKLMSRSDIINRPMSVQRAYFNAFSKEQRAEYWLSKIDESLKLPWSQKEKDHITQISTFIKNNKYIYENKSYSDENTQEMIDLFIYKWKEYAKDSLSWEDKIINSLIGSGYKLKNKNGDLIINLEEASSDLSRSETDYKCHCNKSADYCGSLGCV